MTAMDNSVMPRFEMAVRSVTASSGLRPDSVIQKPDQRDFSGNTVGTSLITPSSRTDLNINHKKFDETRNNETTEDGHFTALRSNFDQQWHSHQTISDGFVTCWV